MTHKHISDIRKVNYLCTELDTIYHRSSLKLGISDSVSIVLYHIYDAGGECLLSDIYKMTGISKQTVNSALRKLEGDGILRSEPHRGKAKKLCLTEQGQIYVTQTVARLFEAECNAFRGWSEEEISTHLRLLEKYNRCLREEIEKL